MKKVFLLLTIGSIGLTAIAQENRSSILFQANHLNERTAHDALSDKYKSGQDARRRQQNAANKTTSVITQRWYNYANYVDTVLNEAGTGNTTGLTALTIWNDTLGQLNYTSGLAHNTMVSAGSVFMPQIAGFNNPLYYAGEMQLTTESFMVDSVTVFGLYQFNPAKMAVVDTLILSFTQGSVAVASDDILYGNFNDASLLGLYGLPTTDSIEFGMVRYDSVTNTAAGTSLVTFKYPLTNSNWADTFGNGIFFKSLALPTPLNVPSGMQVGVAISFKSGDATFIPHDTLNNQYNHFRPLYSFVTDATGANTLFPATSHTDFNSGQFKTLPNFENGWGNVYVPMYAWTSGSGASVLQHNNMDIHVVCTSCTKVVGVNDVVKSVSNTQVYPNPASASVNITFSLVNAASAKVSLTNTLGQVVASQVVTNGDATFNTNALPAGIYLYTIVANGEQTTGRVAIAR